MKRALLSTIAAAVLAQPAAGQHTGVIVPAVVNGAFAKRFPGATDVQWIPVRQESYLASFTRNGAMVLARFAAAGAWEQTATEIGAITLPAVVRSSVIRDYRGYQFTETDLVERAASPSPLYEVHLARPSDTVTVQYEATGTVFHVESRTAALPPVITSVAGTWRGESLCAPGHPSCHDEQAVYHITAGGSDSTAFDTQMNKLVAGKEEEMGRLACTLVIPRAMLYCIGAVGTWHFAVRSDSLIGGLTLSDSTEYRRVRVRRQP